jgi:hypothetical protein
MNYWRVEISFGHRHRDGDLLSVEQVVAAEQRALGEFTNLFQGGQVHRRLGGCITDGYPTLEPCSVVYAVTEHVDTYVERLWLLASEIATLCEQEACLLAITQVNGIVGLVGPKPA